MTGSLSRQFRTTASIGLQSVDDLADGQTAFTENITQSNLSLNGAPSATVGQPGSRQATLGGYGEEQIGFADRVFITGAVRIDAASGFGRAYATAVYPKASASWLVIDHGPTTVRVRGAFRGVWSTADQWGVAIAIPVGSGLCVWQHDGGQHGELARQSYTAP